MVTSTIHLGLLLAVATVADGQSTTPIEPSCGPAPGSCVDVQFFESSVVDLQAQIKQLAGELRSVRAENGRLTSALNDLQVDIGKLKKELANITKGVGEMSGQPVVHAKQCLNKTWGTILKNGTYTRCNFVKKRDDTVLRLVWGGNIGMNHVGNKDASCRRWFFTLNGHECSTPGTIEAVFSTNDKDDYNLRQTYVDGYCHDVAAGGVVVVWNIGDCSSSFLYDTGTPFTGWMSVDRIIVEEVLVEDASKVTV